MKSKYLTANPLAIDRRRKRRHNSKPKIVDRYLGLDEIRAVLAGLDTYTTKDDTSKFQAIRARYGKFHTA